MWRDQQRADFAVLIGQLQAAIVGNRVLQMAYRDEGGHPSTREVEPPCLSFWGGKWTLGAWVSAARGFPQFSA